jgi:hypothetical protein
MMKRSLPQRLRILAAGALLILGTALSAGHAAEMTTAPHMVSESCLDDASEKSGCDLGKEAHSTAANCLSVCPVASVGIIESEAQLATRGVHEPQSPPLLPYTGMSPAPDPSPPKFASNS